MSIRAGSCLLCICWHGLTVAWNGSGHDEDGQFPRFHSWIGLHTQTFWNWPAEDAAGRRQSNIWKHNKFLHWYCCHSGVLAIWKNIFSNYCLKQLGNAIRVSGSNTIEILVISTKLFLSARSLVGMMVPQLLAWSVGDWDHCGSISYRALYQPMVIFYLQTQTTTLVQYRVGVWSQVGTNQSLKLG